MSVTVEGVIDAVAPGRVTSVTRSPRNHVRPNSTGMRSESKFWRLTTSIGVPTSTRSGPASRGVAGAVSIDSSPARMLI